MNAVPLYATLLRQVQKYDSADTEWRLMIHDHKDIIRFDSEVHVLDPELIQQYTYRPEEFLHEHLRLQRGLSWIMLFINDLPSKMEFDMKLSAILVPDETYIAELYSTYHSILAARKKNL